MSGIALWHVIFSLCKHIFISFLFVKYNSCGCYYLISNIFLLVLACCKQNIALLYDEGTTPKKTLAENISALSPSTATLRGRRSNAAQAFLVDLECLANFDVPLEMDLYFLINESISDALCLTIKLMATTMTHYSGPFLFWCTK